MISSTYLIFISALLLTRCQATIHTGTNIIKVDGTITYGKWEGWGVSLAWWGNVFGNRNDILDAAFSFRDNVTLNEFPHIVLPGIGFNIVRYNVGATTLTPLPNNATMVWSPNLPAWKAIHGFWLNNNSINPDDKTSWVWEGVDSFQIGALQGASRRGADLFELFSNSPLWWMCKNRNPSGSDKGTTNNLLKEFYLDHVRYVAAVGSEFAKRFNVNFTSVELFNEPIAPWWNAKGSQEGCHFDADTQGALLALLPEELTKVGLSPTLITASDESYIDQALYTWNAMSNATRSLITKVNVHGYQQGGDRAGLYQAVVVQGKKVLWESEYGDGDGSGVGLLKSLGLDWSQLHETAWVYWQMIDMTSGWGLFWGDVQSNRILAVNTKYFVIAQLTRHIKVGFDVVHVQDNTNSSIIAYNAKKQVLVLVLFNALSSTVNVQVDLSSYSVVPNGSLQHIWMTNITSAIPDPHLSYTKINPPPGVNLQNKILTWDNFNATCVVTIEVEGIS